MTSEPQIADQRLREFFDTTLAITSDLSLPTVLQRIVTAGCEISGAQYGALGILDDTGHISEFVLEGADPEWVERVGFPPEGKGILGHLVEHPETLRLDEISGHPASVGFPEGHPPMHSFLGVPIRIGDEAFGNLYLTEKPGGVAFTDEDETMVIALAAAASVAIQNARLYAETQDFAVLRERERIARDLHDRVIQRLFATAMSLEAAARASTAPEANATLNRAVDELDDTIREIRSTIFELGHVDNTALSAEVQAVADELTPMLGFSPVVLLEGPVDTAVSQRLREHLLIVVREGLTNMAKHANASAASITVRAADDLMLRIVDDGVGITTLANDTSRGLQNLRDRATLLGGHCSARPGPVHGTAIEWTVPISA
jgi:signal transduction histidine kinase